MTLSLHESGRFLFPGTGFPDDFGQAKARGTSLNVPLYPYTLGEVWREAFEAIVPAAFARFAPEAVVLQVGADAHADDPLAHLLLTSQEWMDIFDRLLVLSDGLPLVITGGGGYNLQTVARLWAMVAAHCAGLALFRHHPRAVCRRARHHAPARPHAPDNRSLRSKGISRLCKRAGVPIKRVDCPKDKKQQSRLFFCMRRARFSILCPAFPNRGPFSFFQIAGE